MKKVFCFLSLSAFFLSISCQNKPPVTGDSPIVILNIETPPEKTPPPSEEINTQLDPNDFNRKENCEGNSGSAVVLMYHKFDEPYKSTSVTLEQLKEHLQFFRNNGYKVVPLEKIISAVKKEIPFGEKWVAITIDDAYKSFLKAKPILESYQYPYTIFVNTEAVSKQYPVSMNWEDLKTIAQSHLAEIGAHSHTHGHLVENKSQERIQDVLLSVEQIYQNTGEIPKFYAYPYGEVSLKLIEELKSLNQKSDFYFSAAFSTQSGPIGCSSNLFSLPRFAMNERHGTVDANFKTKLNSGHLPIYDYYPQNQTICREEKIQDIYFSTDPRLNLDNIRCYVSGRNKVLHMNVDNGEVHLRLDKPLGYEADKQRERVNCTLFHKGRYLWSGREFTILKNSPDCSNYRH